jgi:hypothetical protein
VGTLILSCAFALVVATAALAASCLRFRSTVGFLLSVHLLATTEIVAVSLALSTVHALTRSAVLVVFVVAFVLVIVWWLRSERPRPSLASLGHALREALGDNAVAALAAIAVAVHLYLLVVSLTFPQSLPDTLLYHLPRAALWKQQHAVAYVPDAPDERINAFPPVAEIESMASMVLSEGDRYVGLVQLLALAGTSIAIVGIARRLGLSRSAALFGALAFATFTVVALQAPTALNDLVVASLLIVCVYFALGSSRTELALCATALALAVGTKGTVVFALPVLAAFALASQPRSRWWCLAAAGAAGLAAGGFWLVLNLVETGDPRGGAEFDRGLDPALERVRLSFVDLFELSDAEGTGLLASPLWGLGALAVASTVAAVLAARRRLRAGGVALLVGVLAFFAAPLVVTWARVVDRALARARSAVGLGSGGPATRLPEGFLESPMHSSYGLAFVVLFIGAVVLVVNDLRRRRLPVAALVALVGVPSTVLLTALVLAYDPQRMRYVASSVALAATVFGTALRVRALAWTSVALTAATLAVSVGYFVPRPAGLALLSENRNPERAARWFVQAESGAGDAAAFRFLEDRIPPAGTIALDVAPNTYLYPAWDAGLRRTVVFVPDGGPVPEDAKWLVVGPSRPADEDRLAESGWALNLSSPGGWRIFSRS